MTGKENRVIKTLQEQLTDGIDWPSKEDVSGSIFSLFNIQYTYKLPIINLARGILRKRETYASLTVEDIEDMVKNRLEDSKSITYYHNYKYEYRDYALAIEWIEGAVRYFKKMNNSFIVCIDLYC